MAGTVLLIDPDPLVRQQVTTACMQLSVTLTAVDRLTDAVPMIADNPPDVVLLDVDHADSGGFDGFDQLRGRWPRLCAILIAERSLSEQAIEAMKRGAIDYLLKPLSHDELATRIGKALRISRDMTVPPVYETESPDKDADRIVGQSPAMQEVFKLVGLIAPREVNVLITGESGTGKELIAKAVYHHSQRKDKPFLAVNCAAIPETLLESELFGHEKGAFTSAYVRRIGKFEQCHGGTLFLDEIGDIPMTTQAKLLRVLQDGSFQRLGGSETLRANVRIIAATNQPIERLIEERRFRQDLFYRLKVASIEVPPLRDRDLDPVLLAHYFIKRFNRMLGAQIQRLSPHVLPALLNYSWPGNVRELENMIQSSLVVSRGNVFRLEFLPEKIRSAVRPVGDESGETAPTTTSAAMDNYLCDLSRQLLAQKILHGQVHRKMIELAERAVICSALENLSGSLAPTARLLGITRSTLRKKMKQLGIEINTRISRLDEIGHNGQ
ncbi:MAG: sigma-54-dependent Fis family transcriptional regulator [Phycisphaerales bacterium]|nr:sigma-54-dependent Fis family transcriptional regulator [Phycisphaerales bacterium]